jgi:hypothetical protein
MADEDPERLADALEREADQLERRSEELQQRVEEVRREHQPGHGDHAVPGEREAASGSNPDEPGAADDA